MSYQIGNHIKNQKEHHKEEVFNDEFTRMLDENEIEVDEQYLFE